MKLARGIFSQAQKNVVEAHAHDNSKEIKGKERNQTKLSLLTAMTISKLCVLKALAQVCSLILFSSLHTSCLHKLYVYSKEHHGKFLQIKV